MSGRPPFPSRAASRSLPLLLAGVLSVAGYGFQRADEAALVAERDDAIQKVKQIVNQPAEVLPFEPKGTLGTFENGWFHEGANRPDFLGADVRATQRFPYDRYDYVTSNLNPGVMFRGRDLEFNPETKYFYTDRSLPKKRLMEAEMVEINRLYRIIGAREQDLARLRGEPLPGARAAARRQAAASGGQAASGGGAATVTATDPSATPTPKALYVVAGALLLALAVTVARRRAATRH
jgi:hypothetical protein